MDLETSRSGTKTLKSRVVTDQTNDGKTQGHSRKGDKRNANHLSFCFVLGGSGVGTAVIVGYKRKRTTTTTTTTTIYDNNQTANKRTNNHRKDIVLPSPQSHRPSSLSYS